jgi:hypothetical protein
MAQGHKGDRRVVVGPAICVGRARDARGPLEYLSARGQVTRRTSASFMRAVHQSLQRGTAKVIRAAFQCRSEEHVKMTKG